MGLRARGKVQHLALTGCKPFDAGKVPPTSHQHPNRASVQSMCLGQVLVVSAWASALVMQARYRHGLTSLTRSKCRQCAHQKPMHAAPTITTSFSRLYHWPLPRKHCCNMCIHAGGQQPALLGRWEHVCHGGPAAGAAPQGVHGGDGGLAMRAPATPRERLQVNDMPLAALRCTCPFVAACSPTGRGPSRLYCVCLLRGSVWVTKATGAARNVAWAPSQHPRPTFLPLHGTQ